MLRKSIENVFYCKTNGLFAEHLFDDGSVRGADPDDFWLHTQVWAHLSGAAHDMRGLDVCREFCVGEGTRIIPDSGMFSDYINSSTDGLSDLSSGSTATWLLASWPEVNNLFSLCLAKGNRSDDALEMLRSSRISQRQ